MIREEALEATAEAAASAEQLAAHLERLAARMGTTLPIDANTLSAWGDDPRERLHAFLRMFEQLYDLTGRMLFRGFLSLSSEDLRSMSAQNQVRRVEALGGIDSSERWLELGSTRNALVHDYPRNAAAQAQRANRAWSDLPDLIAATRQIISLLRSEGFVP